jgi:cell division protein FtsW
MGMHATVRGSRLGIGWEGPALLLITIALVSFGLVTVYSASAVMAQADGNADYHYMLRQLVGGAMGFVGMIVLAQIDYRHLRLLAWPLLVAVIVALVIVIVPGTENIAPKINGARRWLDVGPMQIQPSEFAKFALIVWTAALAVKKQDKLPSLTRGLLPFLLMWGLVEALIFFEPSFSAGAIALLLALLVVFAAGARIGHFILLAFVAAPVLWQMLDGGYRAGRIYTWVNRTIDPNGSGYQINQALIALGSGGVLGRGFGHGVQKFGFLPEPHNDFLLAMIGEEWGFVGVFALIALFTAFALIGYRIARQAPDTFGFLLAVGLTNLIVVQAALHMAVNFALIPTTGVTLPFMSYGRSSLLICLAAVGVLLNIARRAEGRAE